MAVRVDEMAQQQRSAWDGLSRAWDKWDPQITRQLEPVTEAMVESLGPAPDAHHLDVASGTGEPGISIAAESPQRRVVLTDLAPAMLAVAQRKAEAHGLDNVRVQVAAADELPFADATFNSVSVRFGYMFFPDPAAATAEFARVLRPSGRLCAAVWAEPDGNPWTTIALDAVQGEVPLPAPAEGAPHMYRFARPGALTDVFVAAGLTDVREWDVPVVLTAQSPEQYWAIMSEHVSAVAKALEQVDAPIRRRIRDRALNSVSRFARGGAVRVPGAARCIAATQPTRRTVT